ncbi:MAG: putative toxin-antitoxin system toxin component, PIN family [Rhodospirillaceae bacterium]|nr:putative toxin-antitoxin system toxin component, PIN family [Rhodospirillaceae bacterium]
MKVVFDTNIYVSVFAFPGGRAELALDRAMEKADQVYISLPLLAELNRVLSRKFEADQEQVLRALQVVDKIAVRVEPKFKVAILQDEPDNRVLECAVAAKADAIVTGDKAMLKLKSTMGVRIMTLRAYVETA